MSIFAITISGALKKLYMGETLNFLLFEYGFEKDNFQLADAYYEVHIYANYLLIALVTLHILAVIAHHILFKDKIKNLEQLYDSIHFDDESYGDDWDDDREEDEKNLVLSETAFGKFLRDFS